MDILSFLTSLNALTPIGLAGLCAFFVYKLLRPIKQIKDNHLEHMQASLEQIANNSEKSLEHLDSIKVDMAIVKDRLSYSAWGNKKS